MKIYHCWRCKRDVPMLEEDEWERIAPLLGKQIASIKRIREEHGCDVAMAVRISGREACDLYFKMTGYRETDPGAIPHHRLADCGPECTRCGHLFRTVEANYCANCGLTKEELPAEGA